MQENVQIVTRFPPEPNGYAHIGHAVASYLNFGLAQDYGGLTRLRMDDTNPLTERLEYAEGFIRDMTWLGWRWAGEVSYASNYFEDLYQMAQTLVRDGKAYVDSVPEEEMAQAARHRHHTRYTEPVSRPERGGKSRAVRADAFAQASLKTAHTFYGPKSTLQTTI